MSGDHLDSVRNTVYIHSHRSSTGATLYSIMDDTADKELQATSSLSTEVVEFILECPFLHLVPSLHLSLE